MNEQPQLIQLKRTVQVVPGLHNRIIWTNAANGDYLGEVTFSAGNPAFAPALAQDFVAWISEVTRTVAPVSGAVLDHLNGRSGSRN